MKNKVFSALLAVCLFVGAAIPALAYYGTPADVKKVEFDKSSYQLEEVENIDLTTLLTAYDKNGNRTNFYEDGVDSGVTFTEIRDWWTSNQTLLTVVEENGKYYLGVNEDKTIKADQEITLRVSTATGIEASTKIIVPKNAVTSGKTAYGFRLNDVDLNDDKVITVSGGSKAAFETATGVTAQEASAAVAKGTITVDGVEFKVTAKDGRDDCVVLTAVKNGKTGWEKANLTAKLVASGVFGADVTAAADSWGDGADDTIATNNAYIYTYNSDIIPILSSSSFDDAQKAGWKFSVRTSGTQGWKEVGTNAVTTAYGVDFVVTNVGGKMALAIGQNSAALSGTKVYVRVRNSEFANAQQDKEFTINIKGGVDTVKPVLPVEKTIGVGEVFDLRTLDDTVQGIKKGWVVLNYGSTSQTSKEAGMIAKILTDNKNGFEVKGLAAGVVTIGLFAMNEDGTRGEVLDTMKLNVGNGTAGPTLQSKVDVKVGADVAVKINGLNPDVYVKWSLSNDNINLGSWTGESTRVYGKKVGTATLTARVYESDDKDALLLHTLTAEVTVSAASANGGNGSNGSGNGSSTEPSKNPQTGDSLFANLWF